MLTFPLVPVIFVAAGLLDFVIVGAIYLYAEKMKQKCSEVRRKWPQAKARILSSDLEQRAGKNLTLYSPAVRYEYTVDGKRYESDRCTVYPKWSSSDPRPHKEFVARFPRDREVDVWVNPRDPSDAVLTADPVEGKALRLVMFLLIGMGVVTISVGVLFGVFRPHFPH